MKTNFRRVVAAGALVAIAALCGSVSAQDIQLASSTDLNNIYARLAELESRAASGNVITSGGGCDGKVSDCCEDDCCRAGFVGGGEAMWLKGFNSDGDFGEFNYDDAFRFWIGYQRADGLGARIRYLYVDLDAEPGTDFVDVDAVDFEFFDTVQIGCHWDLVVGGGLRYLDYQEELDGASSLYGVGPVLTAELYRHCTDHSALYAIARQSIIVGSNNNVDDEDTTGSVTELQLGLQVHREAHNGGLLFGRIGWETQGYYDIHDGEELSTLMGAVFSAGIMR